MIDKLTSAITPDTATSATTKLKDSARQFEAILIAQMLKSARESGGSWFGGGEDEAASTATGMAEEQLAQTLASQGGLGLASLAVEGLRKDQEAVDSAKRPPNSI
jgi:Rod binding domain-containing protein